MVSTIQQQKSAILQIPISELVPHSDPMVLLDSVVDFTQTSLTAEVTTHTNSRFYSQELQGIETWVGIEYMAQAIAALAGIRAHLNGESVKPGFLLGTRKMTIYQEQFKLNHTYRVQVTELFMDDSGLGVFDCTITYEDTVICQAKLNVFESNDENQLVNH